MHTECIQWPICQPVERGVGLGGADPGSEMDAHTHTHTHRGLTHTQTHPFAPNMCPIVPSAASVPASTRQTWAVLGFQHRPTGTLPPPARVACSPRRRPRAAISYTLSERIGRAGFHAKECGGAGDRLLRANRARYVDHMAGDYHDYVARWRKTGTGGTTSPDRPSSGSSGAESPY